MPRLATKTARVLCLALLLALLSACGALSGGEGGGGIGGGDAPEVSNPDFQRTPPPVLMPATGSQQSSNGDGVNTAMIDISNVADGYVAASCTSGGNDAFFRVANGSDATDYRLDNTGEVEFFPLSKGDGNYQFTVMLDAGLGNNQVATLHSASASVALSSEQAPFLVPSKIVNYTPESSAVALSYELSEHASTNLEVVQQVYAWVADNVTYDTDKANASAGIMDYDYIPSPDATVAEKKGICYDYASLVAAMLRANGVPCQLAKGMVKTDSGGTINHAWNYIWLEEEGWIATDVPATPEEWSQVDLTFAASAGSNISQFIGSGDNYALNSIQ